MHRDRTLIHVWFTLMGQLKGNIKTTNACVKWYEPKMSPTRASKFANADMAIPAALFVVIILSFRSVNIAQRLQFSLSLLFLVHTWLISSFPFLLQSLHTWYPRQRGNFVYKNPADDERRCSDILGVESADEFSNRISFPTATETFGILANPDCRSVIFFVNFRCKYSVSTGSFSPCFLRLCTQPISSVFLVQWTIKPRLLLILYTTLYLSGWRIDVVSIL